jgi:hypothetical protein
MERWHSSTKMTSKYSGGMAVLLVEGFLLQLGIEFGFALEHRVEALDGGDDDLGRGPDGVRLEALDVVQLGELAVSVRRAEVGELIFGLPAQVGAVDEKQNPIRPAVLDQPVHRGDGHDRLAGAGGHLNERSWTVVLQGLLEVLDGADLVGVEEVALDRGERLEARAKRGRVARIGGVGAFGRVPVVGPGG